MVKIELTQPRTLLQAARYITQKVPAKKTRQLNRDFFHIARQCAVLTRVISEQNANFRGKVLAQLHVCRID